MPAAIAPITRQTPPERLAFARRLRELRVLRGFKTARSFAERLAIDENRYTRYERAEVEPDLSLLVQICKVLGIAPGLLLGLDERGTVSADFADSGQTGPDGQNLVGGPATTNDMVRRSSNAVPIIAWQLAEEMARLGIGGDGVASDPLLVLRLQTDGYAALIADPFATISRLTREPALAAADAETRTRIAELARRLAIAAAAIDVPTAPRA